MIQTPSVSDLVHSIKDCLEEQFQEVMVEGEVSNLSPSAAGHWYFTLRDDVASLSCALFKGDAMRNPLIRTLKNGDKVVLLGNVSVYAPKGTFQLIGKRIMPAGEGALRLQFERLKAKLSSEGLFDLDRKRPIPKFPKRIAVITAEHGAALQDFLNVMNRRTLSHDILIVPAVVQGEASAKSLVNALKRAQSIPEIGVIVLTRGGGSMEDLWSFNDEALVRAIAACSVPTISAVGHEVDYTLCDFVADHRSETPTAAAETLSQPQTELKARMNFCYTHLKSELIKLSQRVQIAHQKFHPRQMLGHISRQVQVGSQRLDESILRLTHGMERASSKRSEQMKRLDQVLSALNPNRVLRRGYAYATNSEGKVVGSIKEFDQVAPAGKIELHFHDGKGIAIKP